MGIFNSEEDNELIENWRKGTSNASRTDCLKLYPEMISSGEKHHEVARILQDQGYDGAGAAHAILAVEEMVKGIIILADAKGFNLRNRIPGVHKFFRDHKIRIELAMLIQITWTPALELTRIAQMLHQHPQLVSKLLRKAGDNREATFQAPRFQRMIKDIEKAIQWWSKADYLKQRGLYVGFHESPVTPGNIDPEDLKLAFDYSEEFMKYSRYIIEELEKLTEDSLSELLSQFNDMDFYSQLQKMLDNRNSIIKS